MPPAKKAAAKKAPATKRTPVKRAAATRPAAPVVVEEPSDLAMVAPAELHTPYSDPVRGRSRSGVISLVLAVVLALVGGAQLLRLSHQQAFGPPHFGVQIGDGIPGTLYLPGPELKDYDDAFPEPKPVGERPPLIVIAHGYSADQQTMSTMARSLARSGYATLTFDFRGHGVNRNRFQGDLNNDLSAVLDWAERSPYIDNTRIAVLGHSMGAGAAMDFSTLDKRVAAMIPVSGSNPPNDVYTPPDSLFIVASGDPKGIHNGMEADAAELSKRSGARVESVEISGTDHITVISDGRTFDAITTFLDKAFDGHHGERLSTGRDDPRRSTVLRYMLTVILLIALLGRAVGKAVRPLETGTSPGAWWLLIGASLITMPLLAVGGFNVLPVGAAQQVAVAFGFAAAILWATRHYVQLGVINGRVADWIGTGDWLPLRSVGIPGLLTGVAMFVLIAPAGVVLHTTVPNFERTIYWVLLALAILPFFAAFEAIVRRGGTLSGILGGLAGRVLLLVLMELGLQVGALPFVLGLVLVQLVVQYIVLEIFAGFAWATGRNTALIAVVDAIFIAWIAVMFSPIG